MLLAGGTPKLEELYLYCCGLDDAAGAQIAAGLAGMDALRIIKLQSNPELGSRFGEALGAVLLAGGAPKLEELILNHCGLDDDAGARIAAGLEGAGVLGRLRLHTKPGMGSSCAGARGAALLAGGWPKLEELFVSRCGLGADDKAQFRKANVGRQVKKYI